MSFVLWPNFILLVCVVIIGSIIGFIIYGLIVGFENTLKEETDTTSDKGAECK